MYQPIWIDWILIGFGIITCLPLLIAQLVMLIEPKGQKAQDLLIGKGQQWRDNSHFKTAYALAMADWIIFFPLFALALWGILLNSGWGYGLLAVAGAIQLYINTFLWFFEKEYVYPTVGPLKYYTYFWGNFMYWGAAALFYGLFRLTEKVF